MAEIVKAEINNFRLTLRLDATVTINGNSWVKPGTEASTSWTTIPESADLLAVRRMMVEGVLNPALDEVLETVIEQAQRADGIRI